MLETMTGGEAIVRSLVTNGIDSIFGIPGVQTYPLFDAVAKHANKLRLYTPRHEQSTAYMATGFAKSTGRPSAFSVVPGPGILNASAAMSTAIAGNAPILLLTGQVPSEFLGVGRGHLHELKNQLGTLENITKWAARIESPGSAPEKINQALQTITGGRPGPAALEMCWDVMMQNMEVKLLSAYEPEEKPQVDDDAIKRATKLLLEARNPMIMVGAGAQHAPEAVLELATILGAPVTAFRSGRGIIPEDHKLGVSSVAAYNLWADTDVLIGIGSRLEMPYMRWTGMNTYIARPEKPHLIRIDIDSSEMQRLQPEVGIVADACDGTYALISELIRRGVKTRASEQRILNSKLKAKRETQRIQPQLEYLEVIRNVLPRDGFFVKDLCQVGYASYFGFPVYEPRTYITSGFQGTLGFAFPTALGVKAANPDKSVVAVVGDGGFMFGIQELATAAQEQLGVVTLVFNNQGYGNIRRDQQRLFQGRDLGANLKSPDFVKLAESFGIRGYRVNSPVLLQPVLSAALERNVPVVIEIVLEQDSEVNPWEFIVRSPESSKGGLKIA